MGDLSTNLRKLMMDRHLTSSRLGEETGVGQPVIHRIAAAKSQNPKIKTLKPIADYFNVSISQLIGAEPLYNQKMCHTEVPLLSWDNIQYYHGERSVLPDDNEWISTDRSVSEKAFALIVEDSAMSPRFPEGAVIIIDPLKPAENRDFVVMKLKQQKRATFKQYLIDGDDIYLKPLNGDFETLRIAATDYECLGVMIQTRINYKFDAVNEKNKAALA